MSSRVWSWSFVVVLGCGPAVSVDTDGGGDDSSAEGSDGSSGPQATTSATATATAGPTASATATATAGPTASGSDSSGGTAVDLGPCGRIAGCLADQGAVNDVLLDRYGPNGTCWEEFPAPTCWVQCAAWLESATENCVAESPACCVCETADDCTFDPTNPTCAGGACTPGGSGDVCDGVSFATDVQPILTEYCIECHGPGGQWPSLDMTEDAYDDLVGVDGIQTMALADYMLVVAGQPELSYLLYKLEGSQAEVAGVASGVQMPNGRPPLAADLQATIRTWIECGAPR